MTFSVTHQDPWLLARFNAPQRMASWSLTHGGFCHNDTVAWLYVDNSTLTLDVDPIPYLQEKLNEQGLNTALGLMTSRPLRYHHDHTITQGTVLAQCLTTLGLGNGAHVAATAPHPAPQSYGTINSLCALNHPLSDGAMMEALSIATQARTAALLDHHSLDKKITGTGTDCLVISCPLPNTDANAEGIYSYAGLHTDIGQALGRVVYEVTSTAITRWQETKSSTR